MRFIFIALTSLLIISGCNKNSKNALSIVPFPNKVEMGYGEFNASGAGFFIDSSMDEYSKKAVNEFAAQLSTVTGAESAVQEGMADKGFIFQLKPELDKEAYKLDINKKAVKIEASSLNGFIYAIETLKQMLPVEFFSKEPITGIEWTIPAAKIDDAPRFGYRGLHLDVSRHFYNVEEVKEYIDIMVFHKMNTFHWHLTDDQGWRVEIKKYPKLTEVGGWRKGTVIRKEWGNSDNIRYGGFYTQEEMKEIVEYAASKGVNVIPEIDLPGHMLAALTAYPEHGCTGGPYEVWQRWGIADDVLCVGQEKTMTFLEDILLEVIEIFPYEYIHIGGDECPKVRWENCPKCQAKIKELGLKDDDKHSAEHYLQSYVTNRIEKFLAERGRKIIGWDEILEGEIEKTATVMSWRGVKGGLEAVSKGHDAIMSPNSHFYFDYYQSTDQDNEPFGIGGYLPIEKSYSFDPITEDMTEEEASHILGVQANLWTEYIKTTQHLHYMLLPRAAALSEVQWCQPENKDYERFTNNADKFCARYELMGYNYATHIFDTKGSISVKDGFVEVELTAPGKYPIKYTLDGTEPSPESSIYKEPIKIKEATILKAKSFRDKIDTRTYTKEFLGHKAMGKEVTLNTQPHPNYTYNAPSLLVDGVRGVHSYRSGDWAGWYGEDFDVTINMDGETYSQVTIGTLIFKWDHIFGPLNLAVSTSEDGENFTQVAFAEYPADAPDDPNNLRNYSVSFPETNAKYLRVSSKPVDAIPDWHEAKGHQGFLFIDEVVVN